MVNEPCIEERIYDLSRLAVATNLTARSVESELRAWMKTLPESRLVTSEMRAELETLFCYVDDIRLAAWEIREAFIREAA